MAGDRYSLLPAACHPLVGGQPGSVLLETARFDAENSRSYLFVNPVQVLSIERADEVPSLFAQIQSCLAEGYFVSGFFGYECGYHFEKIGDPPKCSALPLAWLGVYKQPLIFEHACGEFNRNGGADIRDVARAPSPAEVIVSDCGLTITESRYASALDRIKQYIAAGDTYQVNFTDELRFRFAGNPAALFTALRAQQPVSYSALLNLGDTLVLSFSPELFFRIRGETITTRPMKGTAPRGRNLAEDCQFAAWLARDAKNRSENLMIVDLLRNDVGRICEAGSVRVDEMFAVEKYETLLQMTSTVSGRLRRDAHLYDIFRSLYPCGSVTGAPKIRTMQIIRELEQRARGVYTGAIGLFSPQGDAVFNVAIRTLVLHREASGSWRGRMGVGSGIVFDSVAEDEYRECRLKAEFLTRAGHARGSCCDSAESFQLIESMLWDGGTPLRERHFKRLRDSAEYFDFAFDEDSLRAHISENEQRLQPGTRYKIRLLLSRSGEVRVENLVLDGNTGSGKVMLSPVRVSSADRFLYHKSTRRELYDRLYNEARQRGYDDVIFRNENGEITEGAISNVFIEGDGKLYTPPVSCGLLPGVYREHVLATDPRAEERVLKIEDVVSATAIYICNAVRGMRRVSLVSGPTTL